jgi:hypothetical protein
MLVVSCQDSDFDKYYARPSWLDAPAWQILEQRGDCNTYLQLVSKTLYVKQLEGSGSYTFFVPTDDAFQAFFANNAYGYKSVEDIPADVAAEIVSYTMLYNSYPCDSIGNTLVGYNTWSIGAAYKHQTPSYEVLARDYVDGDSIWVYNSLSGAVTTSTTNNYRYLPVLTRNYWKENGLSTSDYNAFYKESDGSTWSDYGNVLGAQIKEVSAGSGDLYCENGVIHLIDKVVLPLKNLDRMIIDYGNLADDQLPEEVRGGAWSTLKKMLYHKLGDGSYQFLQYTEDAGTIHYFEKMFPDRDLSSLKLRDYRATMPFKLSWEPYSGSVEGDDAYNSGATLFVPDEQAMSDYLNNRIFSYLDDKSDLDAAFNELSDEVLPTLWNSLFANGIVWPTHYQSAQNVVGSNEFINGGRSGNSFNSVIEHSALASNGACHVINFFPKTAAFEGVGSRFLLDPNYSYMEQIYEKNHSTNIYSNMLLSSYSNYGQVDLTLILNSDANMTQQYGIYYDPTAGSTATEGAFRNSSDINVQSQMDRMACTSYIERDTIDRLNLEVDPLNGAYDGWGFTSTYQGEIIRYKKTGRTVNGLPEIAVQSTATLELGGIAEVNATPGNYDANETILMPQSESEPSRFNSTLITRDPSYNSYVNGSVYLVEDGSRPLSYTEDTYSITSYLEWYLRADSAQAVPQHTLFRSYWELAKSSAQAPSIGSGYFTILVPTDEALQYAIDKGLLQSPSVMNANKDLYADSAAYFVNIYILSTDAYPDDGTSTLYSTNAWSAPNATVDISGGWPVSTSYKPMTEEWEDFMSGTTRLTMRLNKVGATHALRFLGRNYTSGNYTSAVAINACDLDGARFDNCVVRQLGQSNIIVPKAVIHSLNGFVLYRIQSKAEAMSE